MRFAVAALAALAVAAPASAEMSVATFLAKADALQAKGIMAIGSPDIKLLQTEMQTVGANYRAELEAARAARKPLHSCPPPKGQGRVGSDEMMAHFRAYPAARRPSVSVKTAFYDLMKRKYPCPA